MNKKNLSIILVAIGLLLIIIGLFGPGLTGMVSLKFSAIINNPPVLYNINNQSVVVGENLTLDVNATDLDNHTLVYTTSNAYYPINNTTGLMSFLFNESHGGDNTVRITVTDELLGQDYQDVVFIGTGEYCGDGGCNNSETCSSCNLDCGSCPAPSQASGGSGGSSGGYVVEDPLLVDKEIIEVELERENSKKEKITIENDKPVSVNVEIDLGEMKDFIELNKEKFTLNKGKKETITLTINAPKDKPNGLNKGYIEIKAGITTKKILVSVIINEKENNFKLSFDSDKELEEGDSIKIIAENKNEIEDVMLNVIINSIDGKNIHTFNEKFSYKNYVYEYIIPNELEGEFIVYYKLDKDAKGIMESEIIKVIKKEEEKLSIVENTLPFGNLAIGGISIGVILIISLLSIPTLRMFYITTNLNKARSFIGKGELKNAKHYYNKIRNSYKKLSKTKRNKLFKECDEVFKLVNKRHK